jgi:hypothetical protein
MKLSEYLKSHGAYGALRSRQTGTELHFNMEPGQTRAPVVLDVGGLSIEGYIEVQRRHGIASDEEFDMTFALRLGEGPVVQAVAVMPAKAKAEVDVSKDPRFTPGPAPNLNPIPAPKAVELPRTPVDRFDPGPGPELNELPEARMMVPSAPEEEEEDGAGPNEVERAMAAEFAPEATEKKAEVKEVKEEKEGKKGAKKTVRQ